MKIEEAIKIFEDWAKCNYEPTKQAAQLALAALRSMQEVGEPLTVEQLKAMRGKWVWIISPDADMTVSAWAYVGENQVFTYWEYEPYKLVGRVVYNICDYGGWLAYPYPPAHIDRSEWISVKERLPERFEHVLVYCKEHRGDIFVSYGYRYDDTGWYVDGIYTTVVTHWMPLPEPPEEGSE